MKDECEASLVAVRVLVGMIGKGRGLDSELVFGGGGSVGAG